MADLDCVHERDCRWKRRGEDIIVIVVVFVSGVSGVSVIIRGKDGLVWVGKLGDEDC